MHKLFIGLFAVGTVLLAAWHYRNIHRAGDYNLLKLHAQNSVYIFGILALLANLAGTYIGSKIEAQRAQEKEKENKEVAERTKAGDMAIKQIEQQGVSTKKYAQLSAEIDNELRELYMMVRFKQPLVASEVKDYKIYVSLSAVGCVYEISITGGQLKNPQGTQGHFTLGVVAGPNADFAKRPYWMHDGPRVFPEGETAFVWDLWMLLHQRPKLRLRDLNSTYITIGVPKDIASKIEGFVLLANDWRVASIATKDRWTDMKGNTFGASGIPDGLQIVYYRTLEGIEMQFWSIDMFHESVIKVDRLSKRQKYQ